MGRIGKYTLKFEQDICISNFSSVAGPKETNGPLKGKFDKHFNDSYFGEKTWEKSESKLQYEAVKILLGKSKYNALDIDFIFSGDLLNQCTSSTFGLKSFSIPFLGQYGACSTMAQAILMGAVMLESQLAQRCVAVTSSHFCSAERQFRFPLEYGSQRTPTSQWTVTASGSVLLENKKDTVKIAHGTVGKIVDLSVKDTNNMGAAMAPAAADTIKNFLVDTSSSPDDYDLILTGDLGKVGSNLLYEILERENIKIKDRHNDCGLIIYDLKGQDIHSGGSGCGCCASVLCADILPKLQSGVYKNILFIATGALMSLTSSQQGESIPSIAHLINLRSKF